MAALYVIKMLTLAILACQMSSSVGIDYTVCDSLQADHGYGYFYYTYDGEDDARETELTGDEYCSDTWLDLLSCALEKFSDEAASETESGTCDLDCSLAAEFVSYLNGKGDDMALCLLGFEQEEYGFTLMSLLSGTLVSSSNLGVDCTDADAFLTLCPVGDEHWYNELTLATNGVYEWGEYGDCGPCAEGDTDGTQTRSQTCSTPLNGGLDCAEQEGLTPADDESQACSCPVNGVYEWGEYGACGPCAEGDTDGTQTRSQTCTTPQHGGLDCAEQGLTQENDQTQDCSCPDGGNNDGNGDGNDGNDDGNDGNNDGNDGNNDGNDGNTTDENDDGTTEEPADNEGGNSMATAPSFAAGLLALPLLICGW